MNNLNETNSDKGTRKNSCGSESSGGFVDFEKYGNQAYGFDFYNKEKEKIPHSYPKMGDSYTPAYKSIVSNGTDMVKVSNSTDIVFKTEMGIPLAVSGNMLTIRGSMSGTKGAVYAYKKDDPEKIVGKLNLNSYDQQSKKVIVVPINKALPPSQSELQSTLNNIFKQAVTTWDVTVANSLDNVTFANGGFVHGGSSGISTYNNDQKELIATYENRYGKLEKNTYYLFYLNSTDVSESNGAIGFMPLKRPVGFIYGTPNQTTVAHELSHGAFRLYHTFSTQNNIAPQGSTSNLMDYPPAGGQAANELWQYQWDLIHDPQTMLFAWSQDESEGEYVSYLGMGTYYTKELLTTINLLLKKSSLFVKVFGQVKSSSELFKFNIYTLEDRVYIDPATNGFFLAANDITEDETYLDILLYQFFNIPIVNTIIDAGSKNNPHYIKFSENINTSKTYNETSTKNPPTVFEEVFHAGQYLFYKKDNIQTPLSKETEVKIARAFILYTNGGFYNTSFQEWYDKDDWGKFIYYGDEDNNYKGIIDYFEAINNNQVTPVLELGFRRAVIKYATDFVYPTYNPSKNWGIEMLNSYEGKTEYFDSLVK